VAEPTVVPSVPATRRDSIVDVLHGVEVPDPYRWLEDATSTETHQWVAQQNDRTRRALDSVGSYDRWHERLLALLSGAFEMPLDLHGDRLFGSLRTGGHPQPVYIVSSASDATVQPRVLIDTSTMADDGAVARDWSYPSRKGGYVAVGISEGGTEQSTLRVIDVDTGLWLTESIPNTRHAALSWFGDDTGFYYSRRPEGDHYNAAIYRHVLGQDWLDDELVWDKLPVKDAFIGGYISQDDRHLLISVGIGWSRTDLYLLDRTTGAWTTLQEGVDATTWLEFDGDALVGVTNLAAPCGRVVSISLAQPGGPDTWTTLIAESDLAIDGSLRAGSSRLVSGLRSGVRVLQRHSLDGAFQEHIELPSFTDIASIAADHEIDEFFLGLSGFGLPTSVYHWSPTGGLARRSNPAMSAAGSEVPFDPDTIVAERITYPSLDGTTIGLYLVRHRDTVQTPETPVLLSGYGGFNIATTPSFSASYVAWCEAGGVVAIAGIRGGNEEGEAWHIAGMRRQKQNVFDDFHAAADFLVTTGRTSRHRLAIRGGSNGGLLVGAALTQRPDLCAAVVCEVPLLDMVRYSGMLIAQSWTHEYGDPAVAEEFAWLRAYSPYHHVVSGTPYPATFFATAEGDSRVDPMHARKMAALVQWATSSDAPILFRQGTRAGHSAGKTNAQMAADAADVLTFLGWQLGVSPP
jgi:prolyl oligopeptidase